MNIEALRERLTREHPFDIKTNSRALVIGLGGSGVRYAGKTKELFVRRYGEKAVKENMDFYCLDTSDNEKPDNIIDDEWQKLSGLHKNNAWINGWLNSRIDELDLKPESEGGGGRRMVGRWKLFSTESLVINHLNGIIGKYNKYLGRTKSEGGVKKIYVVIIGSICGGTGCGTFIDIPYFVRKAIHDSAKAHKEKFEFYGIMELPDSKIGTTAVDNERKKKAYANTYAAMLDLYYFMDKDAVSKDPYKAKFANEHELFVSDDTVFDKCFLVSNNDVNAIDRNIYENINGEAELKSIYLEGAIPEVINAMMSDPRITEDGRKHFDFDSGMDNIRTDGYKKNKNGNWRFGSTFGVSKLEIPLKQIIEAVFSRIFLTLHRQYKTIGDHDLILNIIGEKIGPCFKVQENYRALKTSVNNITIPDVYAGSDSFFKNFIGSINFDADRRKLDIRTEFDNAIDAVYTQYGPFVALKVFEGDLLQMFVNYQLREIEKDVQIKTYTGDINTEMTNVNAITGPFKKRERKEAEKLLIQHKKEYALDTAKLRIYNEIVSWMKEILAEKQKEHTVLFNKITTMLDALRDVFFSSTNINTESEEHIIRNQRNETTHIYSWNSSMVSYQQIDKKMKFLFWKKISFSEQTPPVYTQEKIYRVKNDGTVESRELLFHDINKGERIHIKFGSDDQPNVIGISEVVRFVPGVNEEMPMETMIRGFLQQIKRLEVNVEWLNNLGSHKEEIASVVFPFIVTNMENLIQSFRQGAFVDKIIYSSRDAELNVSYTKSEKEELFGLAVEAFNRQSKPSFPSIAEDTTNAIIDRNYSERFMPVLTDREGNDYSKKMYGGGLIPEKQIESVTIHDTSMMIGVNFYFDYDFASYFYLKECKKYYDKFVEDTNKENGTTDAVGFHITEGPVEDIRPKLSTNF